MTDGAIIKTLKAEIDRAETVKKENNNEQSYYLDGYEYGLRYALDVIKANDLMELIKLAEYYKEN